MATGGKFIIRPEDLDEYYELICKKLKYLHDYDVRVEVKYLCHCTTWTGKNGICELQQVCAESTDMPSGSPLARNEDMKGVWLTPSGARLPKKSAYGSKRLVFKPEDILRYQRPSDEQMSSEEQEKQHEQRGQEDKRYCFEIKDEQVKLAKGKCVKVKKGKQIHTNMDSAGDPTKKEFYLKDKTGGTDRRSGVTHRLRANVFDKHGGACASGELMLLFLESAHYLREWQYIRLILINSQNPMLKWCRETCKSLALNDNGIMEYKYGLLWLYPTGRKTHTILEVLLADDLVFESLSEAPRWTTVGTARRAGREPMLGVIQ